MSEEKTHFIGLGGIGMSALARILLEKGSAVQGSDLRTSVLLEELAQKGALVHIGHQASHIGNATTVVYSSDVPSDNVEMQKAKELKLPILHRSDLLDRLMKGKKPLLVTGTHGKTTVTSLLASVLDAAGFSPSFVIGGIHRGWKTNSRSQKGEFFVAEADESDHSFVKTQSFGAIVTNLENDHLNYWKEQRHLDAAFVQFFAQVQAAEHLFWCGDDARLKNLSPKGISYGFEESNELQIIAFQSTEEGVRFSLEWGGKRYEDIDLSLFGRHNALNGAAVFGLALSLGASETAIRKAFASFAGTCRRLEWKGKAQGIDLYDDYGHHPTEIAVTLKALRDTIRERRLVVVFQPHRFTRVRDLLEEFAPSFAHADLVIMTEIYASNETPIASVTSSALLAKMQETIGDKLLFLPRVDLEKNVAEHVRPYDVVLTLGAGDITQSGELILREVEKKVFRWKVGVLFGGTSSEHAVSLMSARTIAEGLDPKILDVRLFGLTKKGEWFAGSDAIDLLEKGHPVVKEMFPATVLQALLQCDVVIPVFHGQQGEDGMIQGFLDTLNIPYVGCDYRSSALCMHKGWTKHIARAFGIPTAKYHEFTAQAFRQSQELFIQKIEETLQYPLWIKPVHLGSSLGITRVLNAQELLQAAYLVFSLDDTLIAEEEIDGREIEFSLLGNEVIRVAPPGEIVKPDRFHGYAQKYGATASPIEVPAPIDSTTRQIGEEMAREIYQRTGCQGLARIDFFLDRQGHFWFNEVNPFPGFTATSAYPAMWEKAGLTVRAVCNELLILAFHKARALQSIRGK